MFDWGKGSGSSSHNSSIWLYQGCKVLTAPVFGCNKVSRLTSLGWLVSSKFSLFLPLKELSLFWKKWKGKEESHSAPILLESVCCLALRIWPPCYVCWNLMTSSGFMYYWSSPTSCLSCEIFLGTITVRLSLENFWMPWSYLTFRLWNVFSSNYDLFGYG